MYTTSLSIILSVFVGYCTVFSTAAPSEDCFKQEGDLYTTTEDGASRTSAAIACSARANVPCKLPFGGFLNEPRTLNISSTHTDEIFDLIGKVVDTEFKKSIYGSVTTGNFTVEPGQTGYMAFTQYLACNDGVIVGSECFDDVPAGTSVAACRPETLGGTDSKGLPILNGASTFVRTGQDPEVAPTATGNPAATTKPDADSGAVKLLGQGGWWPTMMMAAVVMAAMGMGTCSVAF